MELVLIALHVASNLVWVGALLASVLIATDRMTTAEGAGARAALRVYRWLAVPGFVLSFVFGAVRLGFGWHYYMSATHFMHGKLLFAAIAIAIHHVVGAKLRRLERGEAASATKLGAMGVVFGLCALAAVLVVTVKPF